MEERVDEATIIRRRTFRAKGLGEYEIEIFGPMGTTETLRGRLINIGTTSVTLEVGGRERWIDYSSMIFYDRKDYTLPKLTGTGILK